MALLEGVILVSKRRLLLYTIGLVAAVVQGSIWIRDGVGSSRRASVVARCQQQNAASLRSSSSPTAATTEASVAMLISGQCHRFTYQEQTGPLFANSNSNSTILNVDVFIALQCGGEMAWVNTGPLSIPPYITPTVDGLDTAAIRAWYLQRGARSVTVRLLDELTTVYETVTDQVTHVRSHTPGYNLSHTLAAGRWQIESQKLYGRHAVYAMARHRSRRMHGSSSDAYAAYVYTREDNLYLQPLDLDRVFFHHPQRLVGAAAADLNEFRYDDDGDNFDDDDGDDDRVYLDDHEDDPFIVVDAPCSYGSYSDKMYVSNRAGADLLFGSSRAEYVEKMKRYVLFAYYRRESDPEPLQPEAFVDDSLSMATVQPMELWRTDVRYNGDDVCIPKLYYDCMPDELQQMFVERDLPCCEKV